MQAAKRRLGGIFVGVKQAGSKDCVFLHVKSFASGIWAAGRVFFFCKRDFIGIREHYPALNDRMDWKLNYSSGFGERHSVLFFFFFDEQQNTVSF